MARFQWTPCFARCVPSCARSSRRRSTAPDSPAIRRWRSRRSAAPNIRALGRCRGDPRYRAPPVVTYSRKVFIPLTNLCRDACSYCTFARDEGIRGFTTMSPDEVLAVAEAGRRRGCKRRCSAGRPPRGPLAAVSRGPQAVRPHQHPGYLVEMCRRVLEETGLLPHPNAGVLSRRELAELREVSASQGLMLETVSDRLCEPGGPHANAPDKRPATRLAAIRKAGSSGSPSPAASSSASARPRWSGSRRSWPA